MMRKITTRTKPCNMRANYYKSENQNLIANSES